MYHDVPMNCFRDKHQLQVTSFDVHVAIIKINSAMKWRNMVSISHQGKNWSLWYLWFSFTLILCNICPSFFEMNILYEPVESLFLTLPGNSPFLRMDSSILFAGAIIKTEWIYTKWIMVDWLVGWLKITRFINSIWKTKSLQSWTTFLSRDAAWEESNAYGDLLQEYDKCDVNNCSCTRGRNYSTQAGFVALTKTTHVFCLFELNFFLDFF